MTTAVAVILNERLHSVPVLRDENLVGVVSRADAVHAILESRSESANCDAVTELARNLGQNNLQSRGLLALREYVTRYVQSPEFQSLMNDARQVKGGPASVKYSVSIVISKFKVRRYEGETDYTIEVEKTFEKFKQGAVKDYVQVNRKRAITNKFRQRCV